MKEQSYPVLGWKLSLVMAIIILSVLGGGLVVRQWFQAAPARYPARMRSLPRPRDEAPPRVKDDGNSPARMPHVDDPLPPKKGISHR